MVSDSALGNPSAPPTPGSPGPAPACPATLGHTARPPGVSNKPKVCPWTQRRRQPHRAWGHGAEPSRGEGGSLGGVAALGP